MNARTRQLMLWLILCGWGLLLAPRATAQPTAPLIDWQDAPPKGSLVIVGGAMRFEDPDLWQEIVRLAKEYRLATNPDHKERPKIIVFGTASTNPPRAGIRHANALVRYGAEAVVGPLMPSSTATVTSEHQDSLKAIAAMVKSADGVFFTGGSQERILKALRELDGSPNVVLQEILTLYQRGGVVAGSSAGAAVMSRIAYRDAEFVLPTLVKGIEMGKEIDAGLGLMPPDWFIDQHCLIRGRFARSLVAMREHGFKYGLGIDENTGLVIRDGGVKIVGYKGAIFIDATQATKVADEPRFNWQGVKLAYLDRGDQLDLKSVAITPAPEKLAGERIDPSNAAFKPYYKVPLYSNDILGNTTLIDMMVRLMDTHDDHGIGLAFDGYVARQQATPGFEFRLSRGRDTIAWTTGEFGGEDTTVQNIYLDIKPVTIGPLYK